jgi:hypothetical protein
VQARQTLHHWATSPVQTWNFYLAQAGLELTVLLF